MRVESKASRRQRLDRCRLFDTDRWSRGATKGVSARFLFDQFGWLTTSGEFIAVPGEPSPTGSDPAHPRVSNAEAARTGKQPTYRIADLNNPNLKPWVVERMKNDNAEVLAGKIAFTARSSCMPAGVPGFMAYPLAPIFFIQTAKKVMMIFSGDQQVRHVYLDVPHSKTQSHPGMAVDRPLRRRYACR
jgi:hypothetical protein